MGRNPPKRRVGVVLVTSWPYHFFKSDATKVKIRSAVFTKLVRGVVNATSLDITYSMRYYHLILHVISIDYEL